MQNKRFLIGILGIVLVVGLFFTGCDVFDDLFSGGKRGGTSYTATFDANGGGGTVPPAQKVNKGSNITLPQGTGLSKTGFVFGGWNTNTAGTGAPYAAGSAYTVNEDITLYAKWISNSVSQYTITYNANGASGTVPSAQTISAGSSITVAAQGSLTNSEYTFNGWNTSANGSGTSYSAGETLTVSASITLYAQWLNPAVTSYTVTYNANGASGTVPSAQKVNAGANITLPQGTGLSKTGFTFGGWNTNTAGTGTNYTAGSSITVNANITLYAKWTAVSTGGNFNDITAAQWVAAVKAGWNLGNTLDATSGFEWNMPNPSVAAMEGGWGNPVTTKANITALKNAGFNGIRIPVSWIKAADSNFNIRADWMNRVKEVANYAVENDMYIIINTHHDSGEGYFKLANNSQISNFSKIWTQIANAFKDYNEKLIFESLNEPRTVGGSMEWNGGTSTEHAILNQYHQAFVTAVRATGGNNAKRCLLINAYAASGTSTAANGLVLPTDSAANKLIVSYHSYTPNNFCFGGSTTTWNNDRSAFTSPMDIFKTKFVNNGIPVIIGEFGANNKNNETERARWAAAYVEEAGQRGMPCFWWDTGKTDTAFNTGEDSGYAILNRSTNAFYYSAIVTALTNVTVTTPPPVDPPPSGTTIITLPKNQYGDGYQLQYNPLPSGSTITSGSTYTFTYSFKSDIRVDNLQIVLIDGSEPDAFWRLLSGWTNFGNIAANTVVSGTRTITATGTASSSEAKANVLVFDAAQSTGSPPTLTFTTFDFKKN